MKVRLRLSTEAQAAVRSAPPAAKRELRRALEQLRLGLSGLDVKELWQSTPGPALFRVRAGTWRIVFRLEGKNVQVLRVFPRSQGYGWMERL